jgi:hypothetical protein
MPRIIVQTAPTETSPGAILEGHYEIDNGKVRVTVAGRPVGSEEVKPNEDPEVIARRILRRAKSRSGDFYGPIRYRPPSIV